MSVQQYLEKHMLSRKIENAVNAAVRARTLDPVILISHHMRKSIPSVITKIKARQILNSRGIPTVEVDLFTNKGALGVQLNEWSKRVQISLFVRLKGRTCVSSNYKCLNLDVVESSSSSENIVIDLLFKTMQSLNALR
ncbi:cytosolic enolase 3-like isoform X1 [Castanea sativa]|uniref:cytosolic enolase 3-like isoform X1 n=1 Tax=Castanea sativa TaxID=21020 RepID=UPI003F64FDEE